MTGKEFLNQYSILNRQIRSVKLQLDGMQEVASRNMMNDAFQPEIDKLTDTLKKLISESAAVKKSILNKIQSIENNECREILIKRYVEQKSVTQISREMFMTPQGVRYHLHSGETKIFSLI